MGLEFFYFDSSGTSLVSIINNNITPHNVLKSDSTVDRSKVQKKQNRSLAITFNGTDAARLAITFNGTAAC